MTSIYLDRLQGIETSVAIKAPVKVATTAAITLSGEQTIDGVSVVAGDRVLVKDQASSVDNGIWNASTGAWSRAEDFNGERDAVRGTRIYVSQGSSGGNSEWVVVTDAPEIGATSVTFSSLGSGFSGNFGTLRNVSNATAMAASLVDGEVGVLGGLMYIKDSGATGSDSCTEDLGVDGLKPFMKNTPQHYGAIADGVTDDSSAIAGWVDGLLAGNIVGFIPAGDYLLNSAVVRTVGSPRFGITGAGRGSVRVIIPSSNTTGGFMFSSTSRTGVATFRDFTILKRGQGGTGLQYSQPEGGAQHRRNIVVQNVLIDGEDDVSDYMDTAFNFTGAWRPLLVNCKSDGPWFGLGLEDASLRFAGDYAFNLDGCYGIEMDKCAGWGARTIVQAGVYQGAITGVADVGGGVVRLTFSTAHPFQTGTSVIVIGTTSYNGTHVVSATTSTTIDIPETFVATETGTAYYSTGPEGFMVNNCIFNGCRTGINFVRPAGREPTASIVQTHVNARDNAVILDGVKLPVIMGNSFYNEDAGQEYSGVPHDLFLKDCSEYIISGNHFHFSGNPDRIAVFVESDAAGEGDNGIIASNIFNSGRQYSVWLSANVTGVVVGPNRYSMAATVSEVNDVSTSNDIIDGKTETTGTWTPALSFGGAAVGMTYSVQTGSWLISGGVLNFNISITLTAKGSSTGNAEISLPTGLPGSLAIQANGGVASFGLVSAMASLAGPLARPVSAGSLRLTNQSSSATTNMTEANFTDTTSFVMAGALLLA